MKKRKMCKKSAKKIQPKSVKTEQKKHRISVSLEDHILDDFETIVAYFGFSRTSGVKQALVDYLVRMKRKKSFIEKGKQAKERWGYENTKQ